MRKGELFNLTELCAYIMENGSTTETFITGKPKVFPYIALMLEREKEKFEKVKIEINENKTDVLYLFSEPRVKNVDTEVEEHNHNKEPVIRKKERNQPQQTQLELF